MDINYKLYEHLTQMGVALIYHAQGNTGVLPGYIKPLKKNIKLVGPALTVLLPDVDNLILMKAMSEAKPGDILCIDCGGRTDVGVWGELLTLEALRIGIGGVIINGAISNSEAIIEMGFPVYCRDVSIRKPRTTGSGNIGIPVQYEKTVIFPGDIVVGDRDGVVVISEDKLQDIYLKGLELFNEKITQKSKISNGMSTLDAMGLLR
ncbi:RraA family protein [Escherichia coli]|nr:RraA family protein [Escherichia coli]